MTITATATETLTCVNCGNAWQREVVRGRKPKYCEDCTRLPLGRTRSASPVVPTLTVVPDSDDKPVHKEFRTLLAVCEARIPAMLVGPAGSGKTTAGRQVADLLDLPFAAESCNPQMSKWDLMGFVNAHGGYVPGVLRDAFENGGVVLLDEIDASNPAVLVSINAIASLGVGQGWTFPDGVTVPRHEDFILIAGANTYGDGASDEYVGREQLDAATLDRFACITWDYDETIERIAAGDDAWVSYVQDVRRAAAAANVDLLVTPRASINGAALLRQGMPRATVENIVLFKGLDADARATIRAFI